MMFVERPRAVPPVALAAAGVALGASATFVVVLVGLHGLKPEIDPSWRFISEYAIGEHGWLMSAAFLALALAHAALAVALWSELRTVGGRIGLALLLVSASGLVMAGVFPTDPITTSPEAMTVRGKLHNVGGTLGMAMPFAAAVVSWWLRRRPAWAPVRGRVSWAAICAGIAFVMALLSLGVMLSRSNGAFGPEVRVGWPNRIEILAYCAWLATVAHSAISVARRGRLAEP
jgi:hypothetical protein